MTRTDAERQQAIERLRGWISLGDTVHTILDSVSRSGMSRVVRVVLLRKSVDGSIDTLHPNYAVGRALGIRHAKRNGHEQDGLVIGGCGTDVGFDLVYHIGRALWPTGHGCIGEGCPSNDHSNGDRDRTPHTDERPHWHNDGGYALRHQWL